MKTGLFHALIGQERDWPAQRRAAGQRVEPGVRAAGARRVRAAQRQHARLHAQRHRRQRARLACTRTTLLQRLANILNNAQ